jgi:hypothetical protein
MANSNDSGVYFSSITAHAPYRKGKASMPPKPNVNAMGGVPHTTSSAPMLSTCLGNKSHMANTSL